MILPIEAQRAFDVAGTAAAKKTLVLVEGRGHNDISSAPKCWLELERFVRQLRAQ